MVYRFEGPASKAIKCWHQYWGRPSMVSPILGIFFSIGSKEGAEIEIFETICQVLLMKETLNPKP